jgi:SAM-dependent methyltransferase
MYFFLTILILFLQFLLVLAMLFIASNMLFAIFVVPWVPTHSKIGREMFRLAELKPGETVVDFGCGDGSLLLTAVREFGTAQGIGYEIHPGLRLLGRLRAIKARVSKKIILRGNNFFKVDLPAADVIVTYLFPETQARLEPLLKKYYPSGTRVVSRTFLYPTLPLEKTIKIDEETIRLYRIP